MEDLPVKVGMDIWAPFRPRIVIKEIKDIVGQGPLETEPVILNRDD